jgi:hypothetical protein
MTMRRVSVLLLAVVLTMMLSVGSALAHQSNNHRVCDVRDGKPDVTLTGFTHKEQQNYLDKRKNREDYAGACQNGKGGFKAQDIGKITARQF